MSDTKKFHALPAALTSDDVRAVSYNGKASAWYQAALQQKAGRIIAAGMTKKVTFEAVTGPLNDRIDDAYRTKYKSSPYLQPMISTRAQSATVRVLPY
jgi:hypothetical protein